MDTTNEESARLTALIESARSAPRRWRAYRNKIEGRCFVTDEVVRVDEGWAWPMQRASHPDVARYVIVAAETAEKASLPRLAASPSKNRGVTTGARVVDAWRLVFERNEQVSTGGQHKPLTDVDISLFMTCEFPASDPQSRSEQRVRMYRSCFNRGVSPFSRFGPAATPSREYGADGRPIERRARRQAYRAVGDADALRDEVRRAVDAALVERGATPPQVTIKFDPRRQVEVDAAGKHAKFVTVMRRVAAGLPVLLVGPTGSGKTHLAGQIADALGLPFTFNSMSEGISEAAILGRQLPDAKGAWTYRPSPFVQTFERGGVHLFDEVDASDPNLLVLVNAAIANDLLSVPIKSEEPIKRHKDCIIVCAANTFGRGADRQYVGRNQLDEATLNRFTMGTVFVDYDRNLERAIARAILDDDAAANALIAWAWTTRDNIEANRMRRTLSTRNIADAARLLASGEGMSDVLDAYFQGWTEDEKRKIGGAS